MLKINIPKSANELIYKLQDAGFEAYVVGGCVRDAVLNKEPHDWDICTSATPEEMIEVLKDKHFIPTGIKHGTITFLNHMEPYEITTFRVDGTYSDGRRPDDVTFTKSIEEDLKRRDFTMNAMAYNDKDGLIDPYNGLEDIKNHLIRCVGNPNDRFGEDALRIMRALRFSAKCGFPIEPNTSKQIHKQRENLSLISKERIQNELCKIASTNLFASTLSEYQDVFVVIIPKIMPMIGFLQLNKYHLYDVWNHTLVAVKHLDKENNTDVITKLAMLFHDIGKPQCYQIDTQEHCYHFHGHGKVSAEKTDSILRDLKFDNETRNSIVELVNCHDTTIEATPKAVKRWLNKLGPTQFERLLQIREADTVAHNPKFIQPKLDKLDKIWSIYQEVLEQSACFSMKDLDINGKDIMDAFHMRPGKEIGEKLNECLFLVMDGVLPNDKEMLLDYLRTKENKTIDIEEAEMER